MRRLLFVLFLASAGGLLASVWPPAPATALVKFDFEQKYFVHPGRQVWDFCVIRPDSIYNIFYHSILEQKPGAAEADTIWRATSPDLIHWQIRGPVLLAGPNWYDADRFTPASTASTRTNVFAIPFATCWRAVSRR